MVGCTYTMYRYKVSFLFSLGIEQQPLTLIRLSRKGRLAGRGPRTTKRQVKTVYSKLTGLRQGALV
jgi:hypothetical protein